MTRRPEGASWRVTGRRISDWKMGRNVPESSEAFAVVVRRLIELARGKVSPARVTSGLLDEDQWQQWWSAARVEPATPASQAASSAQSPIQRICDLNPIDLEVHTAIDAPAGTDLGPLPTYVPREHDKWLSEIVADAVSGHSRIAVLVGDSSTGKTRACWEAIQLMPASWRLWHPIQPSRPEAAVDALSQVRPCTVLWLNEANHYLLTPGSSL